MKLIVRKRASVGRVTRRVTKTRVRFVWRHVEGLDEQHELEVLPDTFLAIHQQADQDGWQAFLYETRHEELPFMSFALKSRRVESAKREALQKVTSELTKLVRKLERIKSAA